MLKKFFLSIIILSALASEGGAYFSAGLIDYYLLNFSRLDAIQDRLLSEPAVDSEELSGAHALRKATPAAFYKIISQKAIELKDYTKHNFSGYTAIPPFTAGLAFIVVFYILINIEKPRSTKQFLFAFSDSSPPAFC